MFLSEQTLNALISFWSLRQLEITAQHICTYLLTIQLCVKLADATNNSRHQVFHSEIYTFVEKRP